MGKMKRYISIILLLFITACAGQENQCLGPNGDKTSDSEGIDAYLLEAKIISGVVAKVKEKVIGEAGDWGATQQVFDGIVNSGYYQSAIGAMFTLALVFYGIGVSTGILQITVGDAIIRVVKISVIAFIASNWDFFYIYIAGFFIEGTDELIKYFMDSFSDFYTIQDSQTKPEDENFIFGDLDKIIAILFSQHMIAIMSALFSVFGLNSGPYSLVYALLLGFSNFYLIQAILRVVTIYALSIFAKALLFSLAPIFLSFMLFNQTKAMFDAWVKQLINYSLQPVIVIAFIGMFIALITPLLHETLQLDVCWIDDGDANGGGNWKFVNEEKQPYKFGVNTQSPLHLQTLLLMFFFSWLFGSYVSIAEKIATALTVSVAGNLSEAAAWMNAQRGGAGAAFGRGPLSGVASDTIGGAGKALGKAVDRLDQ